MEINIYKTKAEMGAAAAAVTTEKLQQALARRGEACMVLATGASQFEVLNALVKKPVDWSKVTCFHMDEYIGIGDNHPASFRRYLRERFVSRVPALKTFHYVNGSAPDPQAECDRLEALISKKYVDVVQCGIGENGHLAFNDPPADFETERSYLMVELDEACRRQQLGEGWFKTLDDVPRCALTISIRQIMKAGRIVCTVPDERKAQAVKDCLKSAVSNHHPASILQQHPDCHLFLDNAAASRLEKR
ncbi:MAG: glucosamine-6-phosphate deaminase [Kiritimatiellales bacterium]